MSKPEVITTRKGYQFRFNRDAGFVFNDGVSELSSRSFSSGAADAIEEALFKQRGLWLASNGCVVMRAPRFDDKDGRCIMAFDGQGGSGGSFWDNCPEGRDADTETRLAADEWFEAHPLEEPKPWLNAKPGEVWDVTVGSETYRSIVRECPWTGKLFVQTTVHRYFLTDETIESAAKMLDALEEME